MQKRKVATILFLMFACNIASFAQFPQKPVAGSRNIFELTIGPSLQLPTFYWRPDYEANRLRIGPLAGVGINHRLGDRVDLNLTVFYDMKKIGNWVALATHPNYGVVSQLNNNYVTSAITSSYRLGLKRKFSAGFGIFYGKLVSSKSKVIVSNPNYSTYTRDEDSRDRFLNYDFGIVIQASCLVKFKLRTFTIQMLLMDGLVNTNNTWVFYELPVQKNRSFSLLLKIPLTK